MASKSSLRRRAISSTSQALMLRMGCLYGTHWHLSKHDATDLDEDVDMNVIGHPVAEAGCVA